MKINVLLQVSVVNTHPVIEVRMLACQPWRISVFTGCLALLVWLAHAKSEFQLFGTGLFIPNLPKKIPLHFIHEIERPWRHQYDLKIYQNLPQKSLVRHLLYYVSLQLGPCLLRSNFYVVTQHSCVEERHKERLWSRLTWPFKSAMWHLKQGLSYVRKLPKLLINSAVFSCVPS